MAALVVDLGRPSLQDEDAMTPPRIDYNPLGPDGFRDLCHRLMVAVLGEAFRPFSAGGEDGQRDGTFEGVPKKTELPSGYWVVQYKHHDVANVGAGTARTRFLGAVGLELTGWKTNTGRKPDVLLFVTNVLASGVQDAGTHDRFDTLVKTHGGPKSSSQVLLWDRAHLDLELDAHPQIRRDYCGLSVADVLALFSGSNAMPETSEVSSDDLHLNVGASYVRDWCAVVVVAEIGNTGTRKLTIAGVSVSVDDLGTYRADDVLDPGSKSVEGTTWQGAGATPPIPPEELRQWAWYFPISEPTVRQTLGTEQRRAFVTFRGFPGAERRIEVTLDPPRVSPPSTREPVAAADEQGCAAISLEDLPDGERPQLKVRAGVDATQLVLVLTDHPLAPPSSSTTAAPIAMADERARIPGAGSVQVHAGGVGQVDPARVGQLPNLPRPFFPRPALQHRIEVVLARARRVFGSRHQRSASCRLCVLLGPPGVGKSAMALKVAIDHAAQNRRVYFHRWPQRHTGQVEEGDLVVVDNLVLVRNANPQQLAWICELRCGVLVTTHDRDTADQLLGLCGLQQRAAEIVLEADKLSRDESFALLRDTVPASAFETQPEELATAVTAINGSPFYLRLLAELIFRPETRSLIFRPERPISSLADTAMYRKRLAKIWTNCMARDSPSDYQVLSRLCLVPKFGTGVMYLAQLLNRDAAEVSQILRELRDRGLVDQPLRDDDYTIPHDLVREAFANALPADKVAALRNRYFVHARCAIEEDCVHQSFAGTLDALMLTTIKGFNERDAGTLANSARLFRQLRACRFARSASEVAIRWLQPWIADQVFASCEGVIAVARTLQTIEPRCALLAQIIVRAIDHGDHYASIEAVLAVTCHWTQEEDAESRNQAVQTLIDAGMRMIENAKPDDAWLTGLQLYALACSIDVLADAIAVREAQLSWQPLMRLWQDREVVDALLELAAVLRSVSRGEFGAATRLVAMSRICPEVHHLAMFVRLEQGLPVTEPPLRRHVCNPHLVTVLCRLAHYQPAFDFWSWLFERGFLQAGQFTYTTQDLEFQHAAWRQAARPGGGGGASGPA